MYFPQMAYVVFNSGNDLVGLADGMESARRMLTEYYKQSPDPENIGLLLKKCVPMMLNKVYWA